ncbi:glycolate oxidase FAD binding subunit [compost metagenome]
MPIATAELDLPGSQLIDWGGAQRWLKSSAPAAVIREQVAKAGGHAIGYAQGEHSSAPLPAALMRYHHALKRQLDPQGLFNPGRLYPDL